MLSIASIEQLNRELGDQVLAEARRDPKAYPHRFVGIANGKVVVCSDSLSDVVRRIKEIEPDPRKTYAIDIACDYSKVFEIWEVGWCLAPNGSYATVAPLSKSC